MSSKGVYRFVFKSGVVLEFDADEWELRILGEQIKLTNKDDFGSFYLNLDSLAAYGTEKIDV